MHFISSMSELMGKSVVATSVEEMLVVLIFPLGLGLPLVMSQTSMLMSKKICSL